MSTVALVTDAGTPAVSDPGERARAARRSRAGVRVVPIPGASAVLAALVGERARGRRRGFASSGSCRATASARREAIARVVRDARAGRCCSSRRTGRRRRCASSPTRRPDAPACVARELTKLHEEIVRGTLRDAGDDRTREWLGEVAIVLGAARAGGARGGDRRRRARRADRRELARGTHAKTIAERLAAWSGRPKREVYERVVTRKREPR